MFASILAGLGLHTLSTFKRFLPWILLALLAVGIWAGASTVIKDWKATIYKNGIEAGTTAERNRQDAIARKIEAALVPRLDSIDAKAGRAMVAQHTKETIYVDKINKEIATDPRYHDCSVSGGVLDDRNQVRRSLDATLHPTSGADAKPAS